MVYKVVVLDVVVSMTPNKNEARNDYFAAHSHPKQLIELSDIGQSRLIAQTDWKGQTREHD